MKKRFELLYLKATIQLEFKDNILHVNPNLIVSNDNGHIRMQNVNYPILNNKKFEQLFKSKIFLKNFIFLNAKLKGRP